MSNIETPNPKDDVFYQMDRQAKIGKRIITVIVVVGFVILVYNFIDSIITGKFGLPSIILFSLGIAMYLSLYAGKAWAKWLYIVFQFIGILVYGAGIIISLINVRQISTASLIACFTNTAYSVSIIVLLLASKSVKEFLYRQASG